MNIRKRIIDVHIIESNRPTEPVAEGAALASALTISDIKAHQYVARDRSQFADILATIAAHPRCIPHHRHFLPFLHFAMHATRRGVLIGGDDLVEWRELLDLLLPLRERLEGNLLIAMSACEGFYAFRLACSFERYTYHFLVGSRKKPDWRDVVLAFHVFYHSLFFRTVDLPTAVSAMNIDVLSRQYSFDYTYGSEVQRLYQQTLSMDPDVVAVRGKGSKGKGAYATREPRSL